MSRSHAQGSEIRLSSKLWATSGGVSIEDLQSGALFTNACFTIRTTTHSVLADQLYGPGPHLPGSGSSGEETFSDAPHSAELTAVSPARHDLVAARLAST